MLKLNKVNPLKKYPIPMNTQNKRGPSASSKHQGLHLTGQRMLITLSGSVKIIILLLFLSSCGSFKVNGIPVKASHRKVMTRKDSFIMGASAFAGFTLGIHFKEDIKKLKR